MAGDLYFEDFTVGREFHTDGATVTESQILDFALAFDPQPFHMDLEAAKRSMFGGLIASGFHSMALSFRLFAQTRALAACSLGSPGVDELRWLKPVRPGDSLTVRGSVLGTRVSQSKPDRGFVTLHWEVFNDRGEKVMTLTCPQMILRREAGAA